MGRNGNLTNYHSHSLYCDGRAGMEDFSAICHKRRIYFVWLFHLMPRCLFSTAWAMEWDRMDDYLAEFHRMKKKYARKIELYLGLEIDYLNEESNPSVDCFRKLPLDYRIGSVHMLYNDESEVVDVDVSRRCLQADCG